MEKPKVLVLDDDSISLELYSRELGKNYQVFTSQSILGAKVLLAEEEIQVIVLEPLVEEDAGWAFLVQIHQEQPSIPIILCSIDDDRTKGSQLGAYDHMIKPVLPTRLHQVVDLVIAQKSNLTAGR